jgi:hypothetical protein
MEWITLFADLLFVLGQVAALGFTAFGGWLAFSHVQSFLQEGEGRFEHRHRRRARHKTRSVAGMTPLTGVSSASLRRP